MAHNIRDALKPRVMELRKAGKTWQEIADALGVSSTTAHMAGDPSYEQKRINRDRARRAELTNSNGIHKRFDPSRISAADAQRIVAGIPADTRNPIQRMFGDPPYERSALYQKMQGKP